MIDGVYEYPGPDIIASVEEEVIGYAGMKIDRMYFDRFAQTVRTDGFIAGAVDMGQWDRVIDYVNREVFDRPGGVTTPSPSCARQPPWTAA